MSRDFNPFKVISFIRHLPNFIKLVFRLYTDTRVRIKSKVYVWIGLLYLLFPIDFIHDFLVPVAGYVDDVLILFLLLKAFIKSCPQEVVWEHVREIEKHNQKR